MLIVCRFTSQDQRLLPKLVESAQRHCPDWPILAMSDGPVQGIKPIPTIRMKLTPKRLKRFGQLEAYLIEQFDFLLQDSDLDRVLMVDPDSRFHRKPYLPTGDWIGQINWWPEYGLRYTRTCGCLLSQRFMQMLLVSLHREKTDFRYWHNGEERPSVDATLAYHGQRLGLSPTPWKVPQGQSEVCLQPQYSHLLTSRNFAITHPWRT